MLRNKVLPLLSRDRGKQENTHAKGSESGSASEKRQKPVNPTPKVSRSIDENVVLMATPEDPKFR